MRTRFRVMLGFLVVLALVAAACGDSDDGEAATTAAPETTTEAPTTTVAETTTTVAETTTTTAAPTSLVIWADENRAPALLDIAPAFTEATGVEVEVVQKDFGAIRDDAISQIPTGEGPDIFVGAHDWTGPLAAAGVVAPLSDFPSDKKADYFDAPFSAFTLDGSLYALPYQFEAIAMWVNTTLVGDTLPTTFEELKTVCDGLPAETACVATPGGADGPDAYHQYPFMSAFGGGVFSYDPATGYVADDAGIDSEGSLAGITFMNDLIEGGYLPSYNYGNAQESFQTGNAAFWMTGPWARGDVESGAETNGYEFDVIKIPSMDGNTPRPFFGAQGFFLSSQTENELAAKTFIYDFAASADTMQALYDADPRLPTNVSVFDVVSADPIVGVFTESAADGNPMPNIPEMTGDVWDAWGGALQLIRNGELSVEDAMTAAGDQIRSLLGS